MLSLLTKSRRRGFTLIELLIVVAIIAILAAIAVPNFLEAQVRAKVSAAKNELRVTATALECYVVDNNTYPYAEDQGGSPNLPPGGHPRVNTFNIMAGGITSPIAYLTSVPNDPFKHVVNGLPITAPVYYERAGFGVVDGVAMGKGFSQPRSVYVPADAVDNGKLDGIGADVEVDDDAKTPARYDLYSLGPDLTFNVSSTLKSRYHVNNRYDPTNGSVSVGNVLRLPGGKNFP